jgi:hypothetical protein
MFKFSVIMLIVLSIGAIGCQNQGGHPLNSAMHSVSTALQTKDVAALQSLLSGQTTAALDEVFKAMCTIHSRAKKLPEDMRQGLISKLPKSVISRDKSLFLDELIAQKLSTLKFNEETKFGLKVDTINQEGEKSAIVITKSGESFPFTLEKSGWRIHLFKAPLSKLLKETRTLRKTIKLVVERVARRAQIESVLQPAIQKQKSQK